MIGSIRVQAVGKMKLRVEADAAKCAFAFAAEPGRWQTLVSDADAKLLTTEVAGGFAGATVDVHARLDRSPKPASDQAGAAKNGNISSTGSGFR